MIVNAIKYEENDRYIHIKFAHHADALCGASGAKALYVDPVPADICPGCRERVDRGIVMIEEMLGR
jgi:hypothetical protein